MFSRCISKKFWFGVGFPSKTFEKKTFVLKTFCIKNGYEVITCSHWHFPKVFQFPVNDKQSGPNTFLEAHEVRFKINTLGKCLWT